MAGEKVIVSGSIRTAREFGDTEGIGFTLTLTSNGEQFISTKREMLCRLLSSTLTELVREEGMRE